MSVLWTFLLTLLCVYVCLFVRISVDTTVIIKKICHCLYKRLQICEFPSLPKKWKPQLAIRVFVKKRTTKKSTTLLWTQNQNSLYYYNSNTILIFQTHAILLLKLPICTLVTYLQIPFTGYNACKSYCSKKYWVTILK